jgi:hypothetical protein
MYKVNQLMTNQMNEAKIDRKRLFIITGILMVSSILLIALILRGVKNNAAPPASDITLCDQNQRDLCIVTFGANGPDRMVINFQLPKEDYPLFSVKGLNRGITYDYDCYVAEAVPTSVYCSGPRTPLGDYIELEVYSVEENFLLAHGKIFVSAVIVWTPSGMTYTPSPNGTPSITATTATALPTQTIVIPTQTPVTPSMETAYPNPNPPLIIFTPVPGTGYPNP